MFSLSGLFESLAKQETIQIAAGFLIAAAIIVLISVLKHWFNTINRINYAFPVITSEVGELKHRVFDLFKEFHLLKRDIDQGFIRTEQLIDLVNSRIDQIEDRLKSIEDRDNGDGN